MNPRWSVSFRGALNGDALAELAQRGIMVAAARTRLRSDGTTEVLSRTVWLRAADADDAIAQVKAVLEPFGNFVDFTARPVNYLMYVGFLAEDLDAISQAAEEAEDLRVQGVVSTAGTGRGELILELAATDQDDAARQSRELYAELRERAGLPEAAPLFGFLGYQGPPPPPSAPPPSRQAQLAERSHQLFDEGIFDYAIVAAQTSCELTARAAISELLDAHDDGSESPLLDIARESFQKLRTTSLRDDAARSLWNALAGDSIQEAPWWHSYTEQLVRRHGVVHLGAEPTREEAEASLGAAESFRAHLEARIAQLRSVVDGE